MILVLVENDKFLCNRIKLVYLAEVITSRLSPLHRNRTIWWLLY